MGPSSDDEYEPAELVDDVPVCSTPSPGFSSAPDKFSESSSLGHRVAGLLTGDGVEERNGGIRLHGGKGRIRTVALSPTGTVLCVGGEDGQLCMWDFTQDPVSRRVSPTRVLTPFVNRVSGFQAIVAMHCAKDGSYFVVCQDGDSPALVGAGGAQLGYCAMGERGIMDIVKCKGHLQPVTDSSAHGSEAEKFFTCSRDGSSRLWDSSMFSVKCLFAVKHGSGQLDDTVPVESVCGLSRIAGGKGFATGGQDGKLQVWDSRVQYRPGGAACTCHLTGCTEVAQKNGKVRRHVTPELEYHVGGMAEVENGTPSLVVRTEQSVRSVDLRMSTKMSVVNCVSLPPLLSATETCPLIRGGSPRSFLTGTSADGFKNMIGGHVVEFSLPSDDVTAARWTSWSAGRLDEDVMCVAVSPSGTLFGGLSSGDVVVRPPSARLCEACPFVQWWNRRPVLKAALTAESEKELLRKIGQKSSRDAANDLLF